MDAVTEMPGLAVGPIGGWLAAVGVLRALHRADSHAALWWDGQMPVVRTRLAAPEREIADRMVFSPIVTPWQSGGGWGAKDKAAAARVDELRRSGVPRLAALREAVLAADAVMARAGGRDKRWIVRELRNRLPEPALPWLDAAVPLHDDLATAQVSIGWAPLAGTGGNDGRWDLSANYHAAVLALAPQKAPGRGGATSDPDVARRRGRLTDLWEGTESEPLVAMSGGPYWPQKAGDRSLLNPWAMVLAAEGMLAFGDRPARTLGEATQPWTTPELAPPAAPAERGWGEVWLPLWDTPMTLPEVQLVLGGPWPRWRRRLARRQVEMYAALRTGGFPREVCGVARYGMARRRGQNHEAVLLDLLTPPLPPLVRLDAERAGAHAGVTDVTWMAYVSREQAPGHDGRDPVTGRRWWWEGTVDAHLATRPGQGARTDLDPLPLDPPDDPR